MRDLLMLPGVLALMFAIFRRPFIGAPISLWLSLFGPNAFLYGILHNFRFVFIFTGITLLATVAKKEKTNPRPFEGFYLPLILLLFMMLSYLLSTVTIRAHDEDFAELLKLFSYSLLLLTICTNRQRFELLLIACFSGVAFYAVMEGGRFLASGGSHHVQGYAVYGDNNLIGAAFLTAGPLGLYFVNRVEKLVPRLALLSVVGMFLVAVIGTYSRGALLGLIAITPLLFLFLKGRYRIAMVAIALLGSVVATAFLPSEWDARMDTIQRADQDLSFLERIMAWKVSTAIALENPVFGGGFRAVQDPETWYNHAHRASQIDIGPYVNPAVSDRPRAAHSLYFQVLGDLGFVGLALYLAVMASTFLRLGRTIRMAKSIGDEKWLAAAGLMRIGLVGNCVAGAAVSVAYTDLFFFFITASVLVERLTRQSVAEHQAKKVAEAQAVAPGSAVPVPA